MFNTGVQNVSNSTSLNASEFILVYIASNYTTAGIYKTNALVNTSVYNDTETGIILT